MDPRPTVSAPSAEPTLIDGVALYERLPVEVTHRPPLVLVHGGMHGAWIWADVQEALAAHGWRSVAFDWFSHGRSIALPVQEWTHRSLTAVAHEIGVAAAAVDAAAVPPVIVAHSMGGLAALAHAASRPERLGGLVLLAPVLPREFAGEEIPVEGLDPDVPYGPFPPSLAHALFYDGLSDQDAQRWIGQLQPESPAAVIEAVRWTGQVDVSRITVPVLTVSAELDRLVPPDRVRALATALGATHVHLPETGHGIPVNPGWQHLITMITQWIDLINVLPSRPTS